MGVTVRQNLRDASGETEVPATIIKLLKCLIESDEMIKRGVAHYNWHQATARHKSVL